jgi:hypothetical protein
MMVNVAGRRVAKMSEIASLVVQLRPQLKVKTCWTKTQSCSITDLSSPNCARNEASRSGEAFMPAMISTGSPPKNLNRKKISRITPSRVGSICRMRRRM